MQSQHLRPHCVLLDQSAGTTTTFCRVQGQISVGARFRLKADPCIVDNIYVKSSRRAEALAYLFLLALIVAACIESRSGGRLKVGASGWSCPAIGSPCPMTSIFDIMQTVLVVLVHTPDGVQDLALEHGSTGVPDP